MNKLLRTLPIALSLAACHFSGHAQETPDLKGDGTKESPFVIEEDFDLFLLKQRMDKYQFYTEDKYVELRKDIYLNHGVLNDDGSLSADSLKFSVWKPIGEDSYGKGFYGTFDGNGHTIYGLYINDESAKDSGFFGYIAEGAIVKNLNLVDGYICGGESIGGVVGLCKGSVIDCKNFSTVKSKGSTHQGGGIVGQMYSDKGTISKCENHGLIIGESYPSEWGDMWNCYTGGIAGVARARVDSCINKGKVIAYGWGPVGGIAGTVGASYISNSVNEGFVTSNVDASIGGIVGSNSSSISGCVNMGQVRAQAPGSCIGGIAGANNYNSTVRSSENHADIICDVDSIFVGGVVGHLDGGRSYDTYYTPKVYTSKNFGTISTTSPKSQCGGIVGLCYCGEIHECHNSGHIISYAMAGGILPMGEFHSHVYDSSNSGKIEGLKSTGGIVGKINGEVRNCINSGQISTLEANSDCGGLVGWLDGSSGIVRNGINTGEVGHGKYVGGIVGDNSYNSTIISCYNAGLVFSATDEGRIGGVSGGSGTLRNCYNAGPVHAIGNGMTVGGVTQNVWVRWDNHGNRSGSTMSNCYNVGDVIVDHDDCTVGNLAGSYSLSDRNTLFTNCFYLKGAIYGAIAQYDGDNTKITALDRNDFKTLSETLNSGTDYFESKPYIQGTWRPLLTKNGYYEDPIEPMGYYELTTLDGDSIVVDLGLPMENVFIDNDSANAPTEGYNFITNKKCLRSKLVDEANYDIIENINVDDLYYVRSIAPIFDTACLPFSTERADFYDAEIGIENEFKENTLYITASETVTEGKPFVIKSEKPSFMYAKRHDLILSPVTPITEGILCGTFENLTDIPSDFFMLDSMSGKFMHPQQNAYLNAFRGYIKKDLQDGETIAISFDTNSTELLEADINEPIISIDGLTLTIKQLAPGSMVNIFSIDGKNIANIQTSTNLYIIELPTSGIYVVKIGNYTRKVIVSSDMI